MNYRTVLFLLFAILLASTASVEAQHSRYFFRTLDGRAVLSRTSGSTWLALQIAQPVEVRPGDMINVEGNGRGELSFPDGTMVRIKNNAMITLMRYGINMRLGYAWMNVRRSSDMFKVITPLGSCSVLGTSFDVDVDRFGKSKVQVFRGIVAVRAAEDSRNRQLVLQAGMRTTISENSRVAEKPDKFQASSLETALISEWESRTMPAPSTTGSYQPVGQSKAVSPEVKPVAPPQVQMETGLPPIRPELPTGQIELPPVNELVEGIAPEKPEKTQIIVRQRSDFLEMLRRQQLERDSVIGGRFEAADEMKKDQHNTELGQYHRLSLNIDDNASLSREYYNLRNRILRVQSQIRQVELEITSLVNQNISTSAQRRKISSQQALLKDLQAEHRALTYRLRDVQIEKR